MNDKRVFQLILVLSIAILLVIVALYTLPQAGVIPNWAKVLPKLNATINATCTVLLLTSLWCILQKKVLWHKRINIATFVLSGLFLVSYIVFHSFGVETKFPAESALRPYYLFILLTHIVLAALVLPLVLVSFYLGLSGKIARHRSVSRFTFPVWLYVTTSGVVVYLMISPYYPF